MRYFIFTLILGLGVVQVAQAQVVREQEVLTVSASGLETPLVESGTNISIIDAEALAAQQINDLGAALAGAGISVPQNGGRGTQANLFLRGLPGRYSNLIIDGISFFDAGANQVVWNDITTQGLGRIEIVRGSNGVLYGSNAVAGVVVADTAIGTVDGRAAAPKIFGELGSFASWQAGVATRGTTRNSGGATDYGFSVAHSQTNGFSAADEADGNSEADGYRNLSFRGRSSTELSDNFNLELAAYFSEGRLEYDGGFPLADSDDGEEFERYALRAAGRYQLGSTTHSLGVQHYNSAVEEFTSSERNAERVQLDYSGQARVNKFLRLGWGASHINNEFENTTINFFGSPSLVRRDIDIYGGYGVAHITPINALAISLSARYDEHQLFDGQATWRASLAYNPHPALTLRGLYATGYRAPTLSELYADTYGNDALRLEESVSQEIGFDWRVNNISTLSLTGFQIKVDDLIGYDGATFASVQLDGETKARGVEAAASAHWGGFVAKFNAAYSYVRAQDLDNQRPQSRGVRVPRWQGNATLDWRGDKLSLGGGLRYARGTIDIGNSNLDDYLLVNLRTAYAVSEKVEIYARVENLLDDDYQLVSGYGTAGRSGAIGFRLEL